MPEQQYDPTHRFSRSYYIGLGFQVIWRAFANVPGHIRSKTRLTRHSLQHVAQVWFYTLVRGIGCFWKAVVL